MTAFSSKDVGLFPPEEDCWRVAAPLRDVLLIFALSPGERITPSG